MPSKRSKTLTTTFLENWNPGKRQEYADRDCPGLIVRTGPSGEKVFSYWTDELDDATGEVVRDGAGRPKRKRIRIGAFGPLSLDAARERFRTERAALRARRNGTAGPRAAPESKTVEQLAREYRDDELSAREERSREWSWGIVGRHLLAAEVDGKPLGKWRVRDVTPTVLRAVIDGAKKQRLVEAKKRRTGGPAVARAALHEARAMFEREVGITLPANPAKPLTARRLGLRRSKRSRYLSADEIKALLDALDLSALLDGTAKPAKLSETVRLGIALLLYVPVRSHSLIGARWEEIDFKAATWTIPPARLKLHKDRRADARPFVVPLPATAVAILEKLKALAGESPWVLASPLPPKPGDQPQEPQHIGEKVLIRAAARLQSASPKGRAGARIAVASRFTLHDLRRSWRSLAGDLGVPFEVAEKSLAHTLPGVAEIYARGDYLDLRTDAAARVADALDRIRLGTPAPVAAVVPLAKPVGAAAAAK